MLRHHWARTHSVDERIVLLTILPSNDPYVSDDRRVTVERLSTSLIRITARFGFMEKLDIEPIVKGCARGGLHIGSEDTTYYAADPQIVPKSGGRWNAWRRSLYVFLKRNARPMTSSLGIPADALAKLGLEVPM